MPYSIQIFMQRKIFSMNFTAQVTQMWKISNPRSRKKRQKPQKILENSINRLPKLPQVYPKNQSAYQIVMCPYICCWKWYKTKIWRALFSCKTSLEIRPFALLPGICYISDNLIFLQFPILYYAWNQQSCQ